MSVENLMHPPKKCTCDCCCNCQPRTCGPLPNQEWPESVKKQIGERITEVMETGNKTDLFTSPQQSNALETLLYLQKHELWANSHAKEVINSAIKSAQPESDGK